MCLEFVILLFVFVSHLLRLQKYNFFCIYANISAFFLHIPIIFCTFALDFQKPRLTDIYSQIRLARHYRDRIESEESPRQEGGITYPNNNQYGKSNIKQKVQEVYGYAPA